MSSPVSEFMLQKGPFLTAVPDGDVAPSDGITLPALHKLRTQVDSHSIFDHFTAIVFTLSRSNHLLRPKKRSGRPPSCVKRRVNLDL